MTKQYMQFEDFRKKFLLEYYDSSRKTLYPGGIFWSYNKTDKTNGFVNFFYVIHNDQEKHDKKHKAAIETFLSETLLRDKPNGIRLSYKDKKENQSHKQKEIYTLNQIRLSYQLDSEEKFKDLTEFIKKKMREFCENAKLYASCELLNQDGKPFEEKDEEEFRLQSLITDLVENPNKFSGYKTLKDRLKEIDNMSTGEFVKQYASYGPIQMFVVKKLLDGFKKYRDNKKEKKEIEYKKEHLPAWDNNALKNKFTGEFFTDEAKEITISDCIENYKLQQDNIKIKLVPPEMDKTSAYEVAGGVFKFTATEEQDFTFKFSIKDTSQKIFTDELESEEITVSVKKDDRLKWNNSFPSKPVDRATGAWYQLDIKSCISNFDKHSAVDIQCQVDSKLGAEKDKQYQYELENNVFKFFSEVADTYTAKFVAKSADTGETINNQFVINVVSREGK